MAKDQIADDEISIVTKMSIKTLGCNPGEAKVRGGDVPVARFMGMARGIKETTGNNGDPTYALTGAFEGINLQNGRKFRSAVLYLPGGIQELILQPLDDALSGTAQAPADPTASLSFAFDIYSFPATNPAGYSYRAVDLVIAGRADPLADLKSQIANKPLPVLAAQ